MNSLPAGMFVQGNSFIHRLDARMKLPLLIGLITAVVNTDSAAGYAAITAAAAGIIVLSELGVKTALSPAIGMYPFFIFIFLMNACFFSTEDAWFSFWIIHPSPYGVRQGLNVVLHVLLVIVFSNVMTCTTAPMEITDALKSLISPFRIFKIPADQIAMIISVAIQFIPVLFEEADMIKKAQTARGAMFDSTKFTEKAAAVMPLVIPIFVGAFRRADELSMAMEARGYGGNRKYLKKSEPLHAWDYAAAAAVIALCLLQTVFL